VRAAEGLDTSRLDDFLARPRRAVWVVSAPMMAGMLLHVGYHVADTAFVGRLGPHALAGQHIVVPLIFVLFALVNGVGSGITVLIAQAIGRRDSEAAERVGGTALGLGVVLGIAFLVPGLLIGRWMLAQLGAEGRVAEAAWEYFSVISLGAPLFFVSGLLRHVLHGEGDTRTPMLVIAGATVLNIGLDPIFIFVLGLGVRGAAIATVLTQCLVLAVFLWLLLIRRRNVVRLRLANLLPELRTVRQVLALGLPASANQLFGSVAVALINRVIATFGEAGLAGAGAGMRIDSIVGMPVIGLAMGAITVVGMFAGAGRTDLVRSTAAYVLRWAIGSATVLGVLAFLASGPIMRVFTTDAATIDVGRTYLTFMLLVYPMMGLGMVVARLLLGLGYPLLSLGITVVRLWMVSVPVAWVAVFVYGAPLEAVWWGLVAGAAAGSVVAGLLLWEVVWRRDPTARAAGGR